MICFPKLVEVMEHFQALTLWLSLGGQGGELCASVMLEHRLRKVLQRKH